MAEFLNQKIPERISKEGSDSGFDAMGKPIPMFRRQIAYDHCKQMGITNSEDAWGCVNGVSESLERDQPYDAMAKGMQYLDLTGTYRLMAVLLTAQQK